MLEVRPEKPFGHVASTAARKDHTEALDTELMLVAFLKIGGRRKKKNCLARNSRIWVRLNFVQCL